MNGLDMVLIVVCFGVGFAIAFWFRGKMMSQKVAIANEQAASILADAERQAETLRKEADLEIKDKLFKMKSEFDIETK